ncbi:hypothetical protein BD309DRAFT_890241 [Dichomitus squalens]|uniref:Uncharacterized protein n=2 Tax=Dichomitus squalens TaxID=114155 RepID=A0A4Q9NWZ2_9APHY|nr:uncharacterized protein DICSQDRAFT_155408 [Dichomitus squalens LYAD-421 SS1]EJF60963.1 hypothetical protein DICSQDRAFT_155408 [Dichomitus squalens LYAD-421 SS1]TBU45575.1 hypothetical protein BD309DRAFT_890241 [Dichomitus squalens]TBU58079.1 hypothetical protein BD310DRAFT_879640 [Dichomitus squalens]
MDLIVTVHLRRLMRRLETCRAAGTESGSNLMEVHSLAEGPSRYAAEDKLLDSVFTT